MTYRHSTVNNENSMSAFYSYSNEKIFSFTSISISEFGDLKAGNNRASKYGKFGLRNEFVSTKDGKDETVSNDDPSILKPSGYGQASFLQKVVYKIDSEKIFTSSLYLTTTSDIPRYDRLIEYKDNKLKYSRWDYGPQRWFLGNVGYRSSQSTKLFDELQVNVGYQNYQESRIDRKYQNEIERTRTEKVDVVNFYLKSVKYISNKLSLQYGLESEYEWVNSNGETKNIHTDEHNVSPSRYPDGGNWYSSIGVYGQVNHQLSSKTNAIYGARFTINSLKSVIDSNFYALPFQELKLVNSAPSFQVGLNHQMTKKHQIFTNISSGFRSPNIDDVSKVFDSEPGNVIVPNENLSPEYSYNIDVGWKWSFSDTATFEVNSFYSLIRNTLIRSNYEYNGQDSIFYDGEMSKVQSLVNGGRSHIYGVSTRYNRYFMSHWLVQIKATYVYGEEGNTSDALRHVPPFYGKGSLFYIRNSWTIFASAYYQAKIAFEDLAPTERAKPQIYPVDGALSYLLFDIGTRIKINKCVKVAVTLENILDTFYAGYSSGIPGGGRNFKISATCVF